MKNSGNNIELSIVMPCLNEQETIGICIWKAKTFLYEYGINGEVVVADNGSTDNSAQIAKNLKARVVHVKEKGYGNSLYHGINSARGKYILIADSDDSYEFLTIFPFLEKLRKGADLVMGNRFAGKIYSNAMPWHHKYIGNPVLSFLGKLFFSTKISDFHCGMRAFTKEAFKKMDLRTVGMEFASEIVVKSYLNKFKIDEIPVELHPDGREGKPHLKSFNDGWRHLRFLFMFSPRWLFLYPGFFMALLGAILSTAILFNPDSNWDIHTMLYASGLILIGAQAVIFSVFTRIFAYHEGLIPTTPKLMKTLKKLSLEKILIAGGLLILAGLAIFVYSVYIWKEGTFFEVGIRITLRYVITSVTLIVIGFQVILSGFFINILMLKPQKRTLNE